MFEKVKKIQFPSFNLSNRKYRYLLIELGLFSVFWVLYNLTIMLFPAMDSPSAADILNTNDYYWYIVLMMLSVIPLGGMVFLLGVWWQQRRSEKGDNVCRIP